MIKSLVGIFFALFVTFTFAHASVLQPGITVNSVDSAGWDKLTEEQKANILQQVARTANAAPEVPTVQKLTEYADIGAKVAAAIVSAAQALGVAANEFVKTPVGQLTVALIVWHFMGGVIVHIAGGILILCGGTTALIFIYRKMTEVSITYSPDKTTWFGQARKVSITRGALTDTDIWFLIWWTAATLLATSAAIFSF